MARHNGEQTKQGGVRIVTTQAAENKVAKFDSMDLGERAFSILVDLGLILLIMIILTTMSLYEYTLQFLMKHGK